MNRPLISVFVLVLLFVYCHDLTMAQSTDVRIRVKGSDDMAGRVDRLSKEFVKKNPGVNVVVSGGVRGISFSDLFNSDCEVIMSGHDLTVEEKQVARSKGIDLNKCLVGYGGLAFVTHPNNGTRELTIDQLKGLLMGDLTSWNQVGGSNIPVTIISLEQLDSDVRLFLLRDFLQVPDVKSKVERANSFGGIIRKVASTPGTLGFCRIRDMEHREDSEDVIVLKIKPDSASPAVMPSRASIADGSYPIKRPFFLSYDKKAPVYVMKFVDFVVSQGWNGK